MVLFEALSLLFMVRKRWFWAGLFGSLAFLIWQPMVVYSLVALLLAITCPKEDRSGAALRVLAGIMVPIAFIVAYFYFHSAMRDLVGGDVLFNSRYLTRGQWQTTPLVLRMLLHPSLVWEPISNVVIPYSMTLVPIVIGLIAIVRLYFLRPFEYRFAPLLFSFPAPFLWALLDFQLSDDFFVYLPYVSIGFGALVGLLVGRANTPGLAAVFVSAVLLGLALATTSNWINARAAYALKGTTTDLSQQRKGAQEIEEKFGANVNIASINSPQVLVLLHKVNPNPYLFITAGIDKEIEAKWPGGFEGWLGELDEADVITFFGEGQSLLPTAEATSEHKRQLTNRLHSKYKLEKVGPWWLYVKDALYERERG
jgi:hypothetical protein